MPATRRGWPCTSASRPERSDFALKLKPEISADRLPMRRDASPASPSLEDDGATVRAVTIAAPSIAATLESKGYPVSLSNDAGGYLCNAALYHSLALAERRGGDCRVGFVHIPADLTTPPFDAGRGHRRCPRNHKICARTARPVRCLNLDLTSGALARCLLLNGQTPEQLNDPRSPFPHRCRPRPRCRRDRGTCNGKSNRRLARPPPTPPLCRSTSLQTTVAIRPPPCRPPSTRRPRRTFRSSCRRANSSSAICACGPARGLSERQGRRRLPSRAEQHS